MGQFRTRFRYLTVAQWQRFYVDYRELAALVKRACAGDALPAAVVQAVLQEVARVEDFYRQQVCTFCFRVGGALTEHSHSWMSWRYARR